jgi:RND family efflux transporter MFP subunit
MTPADRRMSPSIRFGRGLLLAVALMAWSARAAAQPADSGLLQFVGVTEAAADVRLGLAVDGLVAQTFVREGDRIAKGAPILALDSRLEAMEAERRRLLQAETARLDSVRVRRGILWTMLDGARRLHERSGGVSADEVRRLELDHQEAVGLERELADAEVREKIELEIARERLEQRTLRSPIEGVVAEIRADIGERVAPGDFVARIVDPRRCHLIVNIDERHARRVAAGDSVPLALRAGDGLVEKTGRVVAVAPIADPASGLVRLKIEFDNEDELIFPGVPGLLHLAVPAGGGAG